MWSVSLETKGHCPAQRSPTGRAIGERVQRDERRVERQLLDGIFLSTQEMDETADNEPSVIIDPGVIR